MIGDQATAVASYGLTPQEQADLAAQIQPGSGLPWVLPVEGWAFLGMGVQTDGATRFTRYSNGTEAVDIAVGPLLDQFFTLATADTVEPVTVAGRAGWKATNADRVYVMWPAADSGRWATMTIVPALADRVDGLIAAVAEINDISENGPPPVVETIPAPVEHTYQGVASVIDTGSGPMIAFGFRDSLPPQGGDIPLAGFDWDMIDGEQSADGTTWFDGPVLFTGTFDGTTFTLRESAVADGSQIETGNLSHDALTPECTLEDMKPGLDLLGTLDFRALQILGTSSDNWDGRCGVYVHAAFDTPELRDALAPLGDQVTITIAFLDITD